MQADAAGAAPVTKSGAAGASWAGAAGAAEAAEAAERTEPAECRPDNTGVGWWWGAHMLQDKHKGHTSTTAGDREVTGAPVLLGVKIQCTVNIWPSAACTYEYIYAACSREVEGPLAPTHCTLACPSPEPRLEDGHDDEVTTSGDGGTNAAVGSR